MKLNNKNAFPANPHTREVALSAMHQVGSAKPTDASSVPLPSSGMLALHDVTKAVMDRTLAMGPVVAAIKGTAVEANHQSWGSSSLSGLIWNFPRVGILLRFFIVWLVFVLPGGWTSSKSLPLSAGSRGAAGCGAAPFILDHRNPDFEGKRNKRTNSIQACYRI